MILSWDIGIKNMAYCLSEYKDKTHKIINWGIINLYDDIPKDESHKCQGIKKDKSKCDKKAKFLENGKYYCGSHTKSDTLIKDCKKCCIENCSNKIMNFHFDTKLIYCTKHSKPFEKKKLIKVSGNKTLQQLTITLYKKLNEIPELLKANKILIENQPVYKNPTMKSVQMILYSYFVMHDLYSFEKELILMSAKNKLKVYDGEPITKFKDIKSKYTRDKKLSIEHCKILLKNCLESDKWLDYFINYKKNRGEGIFGNDDLADTFLMNCYYVKNNLK